MESSPSSLQPQGRACATCSRAKVKCIFANNETQKCQRCQRLQKVCEPAVVRVRAKRRPNNDRKNRVQKLEAKLDGLVTLIKATQQNGTAIHTSRSVSFDKTPESASSEYQRREISDAHQPDFSDGELPPRSQNPALPSFDPKSEIGTTPDYLTGEEIPDELLNRFRTEMSPWLPFVSIPDSVSAADLFQERPFLYLTIVSMSTRNSARQSRLGNLVMQHLADKVFLNHERSMDLLQGMLVYTGWSTGHFHKIPAFTTLVSAMGAVIGDLRIHKPPFVESTHSILSAFKIACGAPLVSSAERTIEERRAFLGYFLIASVLSLLVHRLEHPRWTPYAEECCSYLKDSGIPGDKHAVALIRLQLMFENVPQSLWHMNPDPVSAFPPPISLSKSLEEQLWDLKASFPPEIADTAVIKMGCHNVETAIYRVGLSKPSNGSTVDELGTQRLMMLYSCLQAVKSFLDIFLEIPVSDYQGVPITTYAQFTHVIGTLHLLSTFNHPGWGYHCVKASVNLQEVLATLTERFNEAKHTLGIDPHTTERIDSFSKNAERFEYLRFWFEEKMAALSSQSVQSLPEGQESGLPTGDGRAYDPGYSMDYFDDEWLRDMFGTWDYQVQSGV